MSTKTANIQLIKPDENDFYDISVQNTNMDKIDTELKKYSDHVSNTVSHITSEERTKWNAKLDSSGTVSKATSDGSGNNIVNTYATKSTVAEHTSNKNNPHGVTASQIGAVPTSDTSKYNFINKGLNTVNVDEVFNYNYVTAISESGKGTLPASDTGWLSIMNFYTDHFVTQLAFTCSSSSNANRSVVMWIRERYMGSNSAWSTWRLVYNNSTIKASTTDLTAGSSTLATNTIYLVYE